MKNTLACVAGALALICGYSALSGWVVADPPATAPASPGTRVAVVNINKVLKNYNKAQTLNKTIREKVQGYAKIINEKKEEIQKLQTELTQPGTLAPRKEQIEKQIVNLQRSLQDVDNDARKVISKEQGDIAVQIFREIEGVIRAVATSNNFDIVLSYPDATEDADMLTQENVVRKLAAPAAMPLFYKPHVDMTKAVIDTLNLSYPVAAGQTAPTTIVPTSAHH